jgi:phosphate transport system permease protein
MSYENVKPRSPWKASKKDRLINVAIFLATLVFSFVFVLVSPLSGKLGYFVTFFVTYAIANAALSFKRYSGKAAKDSAIQVLIVCGSLLAVLPIASIVFTVVSKGYKGIQPHIFIFYPYFM